MTDKAIVTRERHELEILTRPRVKAKRFCDRCHREVRWLIPEEAMLLAKISLRDIFKWVEAHEIHFVETADGFLVICAESLTKKHEAK